MWVRSDDTLPTSRKLGALVRALGWSSRGASGQDEAIGIVHRLWWAVMRERPGGVLDGWTPEDVAFAIGRSDSGDGTQTALAIGAAASGLAVVDALIGSGFLAANEDGVLFVPGWLSRNGHRYRELQRSAKPEPEVVPRATVGFPRIPTGSHGKPTDSHATVRYGTERKTKDAAAPRQSVAPEPVNPEGQRAVLEMIVGVAGSTAPTQAVRRGDAVADAVAAVALEMGQPPERLRVAMQVVNRLRKAGIGHPAVLAGIARHWFTHHERIGNPYAYYSTASTAVPVLALVYGAALGIAEHEAQKQATAAFLGGLKS